MQAPRVQRSAMIHLDASLDQVFPLFGPIREKDWAFGWNPDVIYPKEALVAKHMVFRTYGGLHGSPEVYTWVVVNYDPADTFIEYLVTAPERLWVVTVSCRALDSRTIASVTYSYTALTDDGHRKNIQAITNMFANDLKDWEAAINHYLKTGTQLQPH